MPVRDHQLRASLQLKGGLRHCPAEGGTFWASLSAIKRCYDWCLCRAHRCLQIRDLSTTSQCGSSFSCWIERDLGISQGSASLPILRLVAERLVDRSSRDLAPRSLRTRTRRWTLFGHVWDIRRGCRLLCSKGTCKPGSEFWSVNR